jgi:hypothetical protein
MMFWVKSSISLSGATEWPMSIGTYVKPITDTDPNLQGAHWYHSVTPNWHAGRWMRVILPPKVQGSNSLPGGQEFPLDPLYYSQLTRWYFGDNTSGGIGPFPAGTQWWFSPIELATVTDEPDDLISSIFACYSGTRYEVRFSGPKNVLQRYDVAFHIQSMKQAGFSAGTPAGTVESQQSGYTAIYWNSPAMAEAANFYIAIRPQGQMTFTEIYLPLGGPG